MRFVSILAALVVAVAVPGVAQAGPPVDHSHVKETDAGAGDPCGFLTEFELSRNNMTFLQDVRGSDGQLFLLHVNSQFETMVTNPETGESIRIREHLLLRDFSAQHVEGNVWELTAQAVGQYVVEDSEGNVVFRNSGRVTSRYLFDTEGDSEPGGIVLEFEITGVNGPHPGGAEPDFCAIVVDLLG